jgi:GTP-binding protein
MMKRPPHVAIVGKPNSGKSTLFNRIIGSRSAITHALPGVTRDTMAEPVVWNGVEFTLIDTGGFASGVEDPLQREISSRVEKAALEADVIVFIADIDSGPTKEDEDLLDALREIRGKIILVVNKVENDEDRWSAAEFYRLGFKDMHTISALHGIGIGELLDDVVNRLPRRPQPRTESPLKIAIVGKPNVGKSSLVNFLIGEKRNIVSEEPGTTRDAVNLRLRYHGRDLILVDTAGIKRRSRTERGLGTISSIKSLDSIRFADVVMLMLDASQEITRQDTRIGGEAHKARKGVIILLNKWDIVEKEGSTHERYLEKVRDSMKFLSYAPVLAISATTGLRTHKIFPLCLKIADAREKRIPTHSLNELIKRIVEENPPRFSKGGTGKMYYMTQTGVKPPTFTLFVNKSSYFHRSYVRYINNRVRKLFTFEGTAITISLRSKKE